jgi:hypothetical protein
MAGAGSAAKGVCDLRTPFAVEILSVMLSVMLSGISSVI